MLATVAILISIVIITMASTLSDFIIAMNKSSVFVTLENNMHYRLQEFWEILINVPMSKMPTVGNIFIKLLGISLVTLTVGGLVIRTRKVGPTDVFFIGYMGVLLAWSFYDTQFWLPVIPLLIAYSKLSIKKIKISKVVVAIYCCIFVGFGFMALVYSTNITFAGPKFPDRYGTGSLRSTYCEAFHVCADTIDPTVVDARALRLLQDFN